MQNTPDTTTPELETTQRWMMAAITTPGGLQQGLARAREACAWDIDDVVATPAGISPQGRLDIYAKGYWLRLLACMKADYPALQRHLGETLFDFFARGYLDQNPSQSFSLYGLGGGFPPFLRRSQSQVVRATANAAAKAGAEATPGVNLRFPLELARIEQARAESSRATGLEGAPEEPTDPMRLLAGEGFDIELPATTRLVLTSHRFAAFKPWLDGREADIAPVAGAGYIAIKRQRFRVSCEELADWQFYFLAAARRGRRPLLACAKAAARRTGQPLGELLAKLAFWLPAAQAGGLVRVDERREVPSA